jgi:hypothetical protein
MFASLGHGGRLKVEYHNRSVLTAHSDLGFSASLRVSEPGVELPLPSLAVIVGKEWKVVEDSHRRMEYWRWLLSPTMRSFERARADPERGRSFRSLASACCGAWSSLLENWHVGIPLVLAFGG